MVRRKSNARSFSSQHAAREKSRVSVLPHRKPADIRRNLVLREIKHFQKTVHMLIPKGPFSRVVRDIISEMSSSPNDIRVSSVALEALQEAVEAYLVQFFEDCILVAMHAKRVTLQVQDVRLLRRLRGRGDVANK
ncbi:uncharacterized protein LOC117217916 [Megalopta genalis]|uniref:uncharacterized protein LOC117217916 n=1 Tax=Megalopta genalis TaxID=115081 RepID=UPI003FD58D69